MSKFTFKNKAAEAQARAIFDAREDYEKQRQGQQWKRMLLTVANMYPQDRATVYAMLNGTRKVKHRKPNPNIKEVIGPGKNIAGLKPKKSGCKDCPDKLVPVDATPNKAIKMGQDQPGKDHPLGTTKAVLDEFKGDAELLRTTAKGLGINVANSNKPETIARKIAKYYRDTPQTDAK